VRVPVARKNGGIKRNVPWRYASRMGGTLGSAGKLGFPGLHGCAGGASVAMNVPYRRRPAAPSEREVDHTSRGHDTSRYKWARVRLSVSTPPSHVREVVVTPELSICLQALETASTFGSVF